LIDFNTASAFFDNSSQSAQNNLSMLPGHFVLPFKCYL